MKQLLLKNKYILNEKLKKVKSNFSLFKIIQVLTARDKYAAAAAAQSMFVFI